jgi:hypothetical protein
MRNELRSLFEDLFADQRGEDVEKKVEEIVRISSLIGGSLQKEAAEFHADVVRFLKKPKDKKRIAVMKKHALRLEQETREL